GGAGFVGDVGAEDPADVGGAFLLEEVVDVAPGGDEGGGVAVPWGPVAVHLGEGAEVDGAVGGGGGAGPGADVVVVVAGGDVLDGLGVGLPTDQRDAAAARGGLDHLREERVIPTREPVHDVQPPPQ